MPLGPTLAGPRVELRGLRVADVTRAYVDWLNDAEVNRFLETRYVAQTLESVRGFVAAKEASADETLFGIFLREGGHHVGNIKLGPVRARHRLADVSLFLGDRAVWCKGIATESIALVSDFGLVRLGLNKLMASMYASNIGSTRAFERAGWLREATLKDHYILGGQPEDLVIVTCTAKRWKERQAA